MLRSLILAAGDSPRLRRFVDAYGMRLGAARFVGGETLDEVVVTLRALNEQGLRTNTTLLGEHVADPAEAERVTSNYEKVLRRIAAEKLETNVAVKPTHLGAVIDEELAHANIERLVVEAARLGNFIRIDMEDSPLVDPTLRIYRRLREAGHENVGTVLQAYLYRTAEDLESLLPLKPNLRIVKGAYKEPADDRLPEEGGRRRRLRPARRPLPRGCGLHGRGDARRAADREGDRARGRPGPDGDPDALRRPVATPARPRAPGQAGVGRHALRPRLVPVPDAAPGRAAGKPPLLRPQRARELTGSVRDGPKSVTDEDHEFAEPGVAFVHRPDRPSACAYRLLGSASTYSRPVLGASALYDDPVAGCKTRRRRTSRKLRHDLGLTAVLTACENRPVRAAGPLLTLVLIVGFVAGCGGGEGRSTRPTRAVPASSSRAAWSRDPPASDVVASAAEGGAFSVRFGDNLVTVSFGSDRDGAERTCVHTSASVARTSGCSTFSMPSATPYCSGRSTRRTRRSG